MERFSADSITDCYFFSRYTLYFSIHPEGDTFLFQYIFYDVCHVPVFPRNQIGMSFEHGHLRTERGIHRSKFQSDISSTDNSQFFRKLFQFHDRSAGENVRIAFDSFYGRNDAFRSRIDEDARSLQCFFFSP